MNKDFLKHPLTLIFAFFAILFLYSKFGPSLPFSVLSQQKGTPLVVEGTGSATAVPDIAKISIGIEETGSSLASAQKLINQKSKTLTDALKTLGVGEKDTKTTNYSVYPEYDYRSPGSTITGYRISITYEVKIKDIEKVNEILTKVTEAGANTVSNISFEVNEETKNKLLGEAREEAVGKAREKAQSLAKAAGVRLGRIINISESQGITPRPITLEKGIGGTPEETQVQIEPGETELSVMVTVSWEIR
ncbi:SIMPL domain-containing protein [Patescibacteria group bacterium]|nr:SIMPL domain-containing protein [Patescibacteria group bacterium]